MKHWTAFFSQTGSEIVNISQQLGRWPDVICTNKPIGAIASINEELLSRCLDKILFLPTTPSVAEYYTALQHSIDSLITLHGYLRIIPAEVCDIFLMYNGHPGDIINFPILKGKDPQKKACKLGLQQSVSIIHQVSSELDSGTIECSKQCDIEPTDLCKTCSILHNNSIQLWVEFLSKKLNIIV